MKQPACFLAATMLLTACATNPADSSVLQTPSAQGAPEESAGPEPRRTWLWVAGGLAAVAIGVAAGGGGGGGEEESGGGINCTGNECTVPCNTVVGPDGICGP